MVRESVISIGTFDGVHKGHQTILNKVVKVSIEKKLKSIVISFEKPLKRVYGLLTLPQEKIELLSLFGIDEILLLPINKKITSMTAEQFFDEILIKRLKVKHIVVGYDCAFGRNRTGNLLWLKNKTEQNNVALDIINPVKVGNMIVSSSKIRSLIQKDNITLANKMLNRPFGFSGEHLRGNQIGRELGFPTVNVKTDKNKILPRGVFICAIKDESGRLYPGVLNIGVRPTVKIKKHNLSIEVHLLNYSGVWKEKNIKVIVYKRIRSEKNFKKINFLRQAIKKDVYKANKFFSSK